MQNHLRRSHRDTEPVSRRQGRPIPPAVSPENQDVSLQLSHHGVDNEQGMIDAEHDDDDVVVRGSDPNEDDMIIGSPDDWGDRDRQIHSSSIRSYEPPSLFSVHHSPSYGHEVSPQVPAQRSMTLTVPESATPAIRVNERDTFGELCPRYITKHITYAPK